MSLRNHHRCHSTVVQSLSASMSIAQARRLSSVVRARSVLVISGSDYLLSQYSLHCSVVFVVVRVHESFVSAALNFSPDHCHMVGHPACDSC